MSTGKRNRNRELSLQLNRQTGYNSNETIERQVLL